MNLNQVLQQYKRQSMSQQINERQTIATIEQLLNDWEQSPFLNAYQQTFTEVYADVKNTLGEYLITQAIQHRFQNMIVKQSQLIHDVLAPLDNQIRYSHINNNSPRLSILTNDLKDAASTYELPYVEHQIQPDFKIIYRCLATKEKEIDLLLIKYQDGIDYETQIPLRELISSQKGNTQLPFDFGSNWHFRLKFLPALLDSFNLAYRQIDLQNAMLIL